MAFPPSSILVIDMFLPSCPEMNASDERRLVFADAVVGGVTWWSGVNEDLASVRPSMSTSDPIAESRHRKAEDYGPRTMRGWARIRWISLDDVEDA